MDAGTHGLQQRARARALAATRWFVTDEIRALGDTATTRALLLVLGCPVIIIITLIPALAQLIDGQPTPLSLPIMIATVLIFGAAPLILRWTGSPTAAGVWFLGAGMLVTGHVVYRQQGLDSVLTVWLLVIPVFAGFFLGARWALIFSLAAIVMISGFWLLELLPGSALSFDPALAKPEGLHLRWLNLVAALVAISSLAVFWELAMARTRREREELEAQIRHGQKLETVGMLAGGIAHDFNNILAAILGHASLLADEVHEPGAQRRVQAIVDSSRRAAVLVEQMLAYAGRSRTRTGALDVPELVSEVVELVRPALNKKTELILDLDRRCPQIAADPVQIQQIAMNLVTNASEALDGQPGRVWVRTATVDVDGVELERAPTPDDFVMLEVRDEGCGIPPETLETIFDPFYTTKPSGHGLGLAAVLGIVNNHGGDIEVDSTVGVGSRFRVLLPCPDAETLAAAEPEDAPRPRVRLPTATSPASLHTGQPDAQPRRRRHAGPPCILVVDDERMVRELALEVLERAGYQVLLGHDGNHGLEVFMAHGPEIDLVILDRTMPGRDGLELLAEMRKRRPDLPAIISSGYANDDGTRRLRSLGIDAILQKPWAPSDLVHVVDALGFGSQTPEGGSQTPEGGPTQTPHTAAKP